MTPSINRLAESAKALGEYIQECEFELVREEFGNAPIANFSQFARWVTGYMYYNALVCACGGNEQNINNALAQAYDELTAVVGRQAG